MHEQQQFYIPRGTSLSSSWHERANQMRSSACSDCCIMATNFEHKFFNMIQFGCTCTNALQAICTIFQHLQIHAMTSITAHELFNIWQNHFMQRACHIFQSTACIAHKFSVSGTKLHMNFGPRLGNFGHSLGNVRPLCQFAT